MDRRKPTMIVVYNDEVYTELRNIWLYNAKHRSVDQATDYEAFLVTGMDGLADLYEDGKALEGFPGLYAMTFRRNPRGDGHIAVFEVDHVAETVTVLHVFHTKQDLGGRLARER